MQGSWGLHRKADVNQTIADSRHVTQEGLEPELTTAAQDDAAWTWSLTWMRHGSEAAPATTQCKKCTKVAAPMLPARGSVPELPQQESHRVLCKAEAPPTATRGLVKDQGPSALSNELGMEYGMWSQWCYKPPTTATQNQETTGSQPTCAAGVQASLMVFHRVDKHAPPQHMARIAAAFGSEHMPAPLLP